MNLQETIRRILMENMNVKFYLLRRYDYDELNNILQNSLQTQSRNLKHYKDKTFNYFNNAVVRSMTERIGEELTDGWIEDLPIPENEIYDFVESLFKDEIIKKYDYLVLNDMNLQENIRRILREQTGKIKWVKPEFEKEEGEFGEHFLRWLEDDVLPVNFNELTDEQFNKLWNKIRKSYKKGKIEPLSDDEWKKMENTDSWNIETEKDLFDVIHGQWGRSKQRIKKYSINPIKNGGVVETPIVAYTKGYPPYLVAGNTRLSACRVLGIKPMVTKIKI